MLVLEGVMAIRKHLLGSHRLSTLLGVVLLGCGLAREVEEGGLRGPEPSGRAVLVAQERKGPRQLMQVPLDRPAGDGVPLVAEPSFQRGRVNLPGLPWQHP
jgi:hypothetical protein